MWRRFGFRFARGDTRFHVMNVFNSALMQTPGLAGALTCTTDPILPNNEEIVVT
jgi:hypothetical protein